ncbi:hypothetical protein AB5J72_06410 [Streptomyces sp. CG1]|uniref:hypothetical protein n=1 Tax=Streptomyces sp. CG1 TaxID=1287523 RepID=UPI0034E1A223
MDSTAHITAQDPLLDALCGYGLHCDPRQAGAGTYIEIALADASYLHVSGTTKDGTSARTLHCLDQHASWQAHVVNPFDNSHTTVYDSHGQALSYEDDTSAAASAIARFVHDHDNQVRIRERLNAIRARLTAADLPALHIRCSSRNANGNQTHDARSPGAMQTDVEICAANGDRVARVSCGREPTDTDNPTKALVLATAAADLGAHAPADLAFLLSLVSDRNR